MCERRRKRTESTEECAPAVLSSPSSPFFLPDKNTNVSTLTIHYFSLPDQIIIL